MRRDAGNHIFGDGALWSRHEIKYLISESKAAAIAQFIKPYVQLDRYCKLQPDGSYPVVSLYLDSEDLRLCRDSLTGNKNRFKLRIRSYTDDLDYPRFFEIKRRLNTIIIKDRAQVTHQDLAPLISLTPYLPNNGNGNNMLRQFQLYMKNINGRPVVRTRYQRQAFESPVDDRVRITFDRNLCYNVTSGPDVGFDGRGWQQILSNRVVLEIKFTGHYPAWLSQIVRCFNLRQQSLSKYARSIKKACLLKFCAPEIPRRMY